MKRVLWVIKTLAPGGAERLLAMTAARLDRQQFEVACAYVTETEPNLIAELERHGVACMHVGGRSWPLRLFRLVRSGEFDVIHAHSPAPAAVTRLANRLRRRSRRAAHITTEHNPRQHYRAVSRGLTTLTSVLDDVVLAPSDEVAASISGVARSRCHVRRQGIDLAPFRRSAEQRHDRGDGPLRILCVAHLRPEKGHEVLLRACRLLAESGADFRVSLVGGTPTQRDAQYAAGLHRLVDESGLASVVSFLGARDDVADVMGRHDVLVIPSSYEAGPLVAMEAAAARLPIVSTNVGLVKELFIDGVHCLVTEIGDASSLHRALARLLGDAALANELAVAAEHMSAVFDITNVTRDLEAIYREAVPVARSGRR